MRTLWAILLGGLAFIGTAEARLGESLSELEARYGKATKLSENLKRFSLGAECYTFSHDEYLYIFYLVEGKAEVLMLAKNKSKEKLTEEEVNKILKQNSSGQGFVKGGEQEADPRFTQTYLESENQPEKKRIAIWEKGAGMLGVASWKWAEKMGDDTFLKTYLSKEDLAKATKNLEEQRSSVGK